jgi:hypothetical protein
VRAVLEEVSISTHFFLIAALRARQVPCFGRLVSIERRQTSRLSDEVTKSPVVQTQAILIYRVLLTKLCIAYVDW